MVTGDIIQVKHYKDSTWSERMFLHKVNDRNFLCVYTGMETDYKNGFPIDITSWQYCNTK